MNRVRITPRSAPMLLLAAALANSAFSQMPPAPPPPQTPALTEGIALLRADRLDEAERALGPVAGTQGTDAATAQFYLGLIEQTRAERATDASSRRTAFRAARHHYEAAAVGLPNSGATLNNLARVLAALGDAAGANNAIERALALNDGKGTAYLRTRAEVAERLQAPAPQRLAAGRAALEAAPEDDALREQFVTLALATDPASLVASANALNAAGSVQAAEALIVRALPDPRAPREALMLAFAQARSGQRYDPRDFKATSSGAALRTLADDPTIGPCVRELLALHAAPSANQTDYPWWATGPGSRRTGLQRLALALATYYRTQGTPEALRAAQPYAELALSLAGDTVDPEAILELADIYATTGQRARLQAMANEQVQPLFVGKADAIRRDDDRELYSYHLALGSIFGYLEQWGSINQPASAIYQLEHARQTAARLNVVPRAAQVVVPPSVVELLADAYVATNLPDDSARVRLAAAAVYREQKRPALESAVLDVPAAKLTPVLEKSSNATRAQWAATRPLPPGVTYVPLPKPEPVVNPDAINVPQTPAPNALPPGNSAGEDSIAQEAPMNQAAQVTMQPWVMNRREETPVNQNAHVAVVMGPVQPGVNLQGADLPGTGTPATSPDDCAETCRWISDCRAMTFVHTAPSRGVCWLKGSVPPASAVSNMSSAVKQP